MGIFKKKQKSEEKDNSPIGTFTIDDLKNREVENESSKENVNLKDDYVSLINVNKIYNKNVHAVVDFNLNVKEREFVVFVGPSGCGKSTTLRMIAGLEEISAGDLIIDGKHANDLNPKDRDIAMVFQSYSLYPNMTVYDNLAFSLKVRKTPKEEINKRVTEAAEILDIKELLDRKPSQLSGGQRQRVALGRAIVRNAKVFLMDEPLSNLDAKLRVQMRSEIIKLHKKVKATTIYVTHDQTEAMTMADRIVVMKKGYVQQIGTPLEIYLHPANQFVASFLGSPSMNFMEAIFDNKSKSIIFKDGTKYKLEKNQINHIYSYYEKEKEQLEKTIPSFLEFLKNEENNKQNKKSLFKKKEETKDVTLDPDYLKLVEHLENIKKILTKDSTFEIMFGIRPEDIIQVSEEDKNSFSSEVILVELLGKQYYVHFQYGGQEILSSIISEHLLSAGDKINLKIINKNIHLFDFLTGKTII